MRVTLYNTLTRKKEIFRPLRKGRVGLYTCGPTVYNYAHIGNLRTYIFEDVLRRTLEYAGYRVRHVMNITDVGHLTSDADEGEDKMEREAEKEKRSVWDIARFYTNAFLKDIARLNIKKSHALSPATKNISEQIALIEKLFKKGIAYETKQAIYFDISRFPGYTKLSRQKLSAKMTGAREEVVADPEKRNPQDFALWFKLTGRFARHIMRWSSPWGTGFPGWHIECSAISTKYLGQPFDIHTGGADHIAVHHTNEIAQSEGAYGKPLAKIWMHGEFLLINESKMAKSAGNFYTVETIIEKGFTPLAFRYLCLTAHYRTKINFTWESLEAAQRALTRIKSDLGLLIHSRKHMGHLLPKEGSYFTNCVKQCKQDFTEAIFDDLNTPRALAVLHNLLRLRSEIKDSKILGQKIVKTAEAFDKILGVGIGKIIAEIKQEKIPKKVLALAREREQYRAQKNWAKSDEIRKKIESLDHMIEDMANGFRINKAK